jgi:hypothetical protein
LARKTANPKVGTESVLIASAQTTAADDHLRKRRGALAVVGTFESIATSRNGAALVVVALFDAAACVVVGRSEGA